MRLLGLISLSPVLGSVLPLPRSYQQDGYTKSIAPWVAHGGGGNLTGIPLIPQLDLSQRRRNLTMKREKASVKEASEGGEKKRQGRESRRWGERALQWVLQAEYSGRTFFDGYVLQVVSYPIRGVDRSWDFFTAPGTFASNPLVLPAPKQKLALTEDPTHGSEQPSWACKRRADCSHQVKIVLRAELMGGTSIAKRHSARDWHFGHRTVPLVYR